MPLINGALEKKNALFVSISIVPKDQSHLIGVSENQVARDDQTMSQIPQEDLKEDRKEEELATSVIIEVKKEEST